MFSGCSQSLHVFQSCGDLTWPLGKATEERGWCMVALDPPNFCIQLQLLQKGWFR